MKIKGNNLREALRIANISQAKAAEQLGISRQTLVTRLNDEELDVDFVLKIKRVLQIDLSLGNDIVQNIPQVIKLSPRLEANPTNLAINTEEIEEAHDRFFELPDGTLVMWVVKVTAKPQAGYLRGFQDPEYFEDMQRIPIEVQKRHTAHYLAFEVTGDSMTPEIIPENEELIKTCAIWEGWTVVGRELPRRQWQFKLHTHYVDAWIIVHNIDGILIKNIKHHDIEKAEITIHSLNPKYKDEVLSLNDVAQIFSVVRRLPPEY